MEELYNDWSELNHASVELSGRVSKVPGVDISTWSSPLREQRGAGLLQKKAQVNCQLELAEHFRQSLTVAPNTVGASN